MVLVKGGPAIKVRTIRRKTEADRWSVEAINEIVATPQQPNPKDEDQEEVEAEGKTAGLDVGGDGTKLPCVEVEEVEKRLRDFKVTSKLLQDYGHSDACPGCEGMLTGKRRQHTRLSADGDLRTL